jgi:hypothetical protein
VKPYYVALTGSKNNAGDYLIKHRASQLFAALRPDRDVVHMDGWKPLDDAALEVVNGAAALVLAGGPALQAHMHPRVYALRPRLDDIRAPIVAMGIGWMSPRGDWRDTRDYPLAPATLALLRRIADAGVTSSVRDFHTLNVLALRGFGNWLMTGCPAYYDLDALARPIPSPDPVGKLVFSPGVTFVRSARMAAQQRDIVLRLRDAAGARPFEVAFHHSLDPKRFLDAYPGKRRHFERHLELAAWLRGQGIACMDISGSAERMVEYYDGAVLHVGYRVHAHIFMASRSRPSVLLAEDGRGKATRQVVGGMVVDAFDSLRTRGLRRWLARWLAFDDPYAANPAAADEVAAMLAYEAASGGHHVGATRALVERNYGVMHRFVAQLP